MNVFPPIFTNRSLLPKQLSVSNTSSKIHHPPRRVCFETIEKNSVESNKNVEDLTKDKEKQNAEVMQTSTNETVKQKKQSEITSEGSSSNPQETIGKSTDLRFAANNQFYFKYSAKDLMEHEDEEDSPSEMSDFVDNDWSDAESGGGTSSRQRSREAQEAEIQNRYQEAMKKLRRKEFEQAIGTLATILVHPLMKQYYVPDWEAFDWQKQEKKEGGDETTAEQCRSTNIGSPKMLTNLAKIYFNVNLVLALLMDNSVPFYMQALSICPDFDDIWFNCGKAAFQLGYWRTVKFCLTRCAKEFRAMEALLLVHFMCDEFPECFQLLKKLFQLHPEHQMGHVIRQQIATTNQYWAELERKTFTDEIVAFRPTIEEENKILLRIRQFKSKMEENGIKEDNVNGKSDKFNIFRNEFNETHPIKFAPLRVKLRHAMGIEELGKLLCDTFDRIEMFSTFIEQKICFQIDPNDDGGIFEDEVVEESILEFEDNDNINKDEKISAENATDELIDGLLKQMAATTAQSLTTMIELNDPIEGQQNELMEENRGEEEKYGDELANVPSIDPIPLESASQEEDTETNTTNLMGTTTTNVGNDERKKIMMKGKQQNRNRKTIEQIQGAERSENIEVMNILRRSLRRLIDEDMQGGMSPNNNNNNNEEKEGSGGELTVLKMMDLDDPQLSADLIKLMNPPIAAEFKMDTFEEEAKENEECYPPNTQKLIKQLVESSLQENTNNILHCLLEYLKWISIECNTIHLTLEQAEIYRQVYTRWSSAVYSSPSKIPLSTELDISIHQLSAELGSHRALSIVQAHYECKFMDSSIQEYNNRKLFVGIDNESDEIIAGKEFERGEIEEKCEEISLNNDEDLLRKIIGKIAKEKRQTTIEKKSQIAQGNSIDVENGDGKGQDSTDQSNSMAKTCHSEKAKILELRYRWLITNLQPNELGLDENGTTLLYDHFAYTCAQLSKAIDLVGDNPEWRIFTHANFGMNCLSKRNLEENLHQKMLNFQSQHIEQLTEAQKYLELKNVLLHGYDWNALANDFHASKIFLMIKCLQETDKSKAHILSWIIRILALLVGQKFDDIQGKGILRRCLNSLNTIFPLDDDFDELGDEHQIRQLGNLLGRLAHPQHFPYLVRSIDLWRWCFRICKYLEGELNTKLMVDLHNIQCESEEVVESEPSGPRRHLPSRTLLVLSKAHEVLGRGRKCGKRQGQFLGLILDEFAAILAHYDVYNLINTSKFDNIRENIIHEIIQCLHCAFSANYPNQPKNRSRYADHSSKLQWSPDWTLAQKVLPLLMPRKLPEMSSDTRVSFDFVDTVGKLFAPTLLSIDRCRLDAIDALCQKPPKLELIEQFDTDGLWCAYEEKIEMDEEGRKRIQELIEAKNMAEISVIDEVEGPQISMEMAENNKKQEELKAKIFYLMAHFHNRSGNTDTARTHLRECLSIGHSHLTPNILSSAWYAYGQTRIFGYTILSDDQLFEQVDAYLFPFKMAIYLNWEFPEAHLDIGTLMYQLRTRLMRFKKQDAKTESDGDKEIMKKIMQRVEGMLQKARLHFQMAQRFNFESTKDIGWLTNYFHAKISEKLGEPAEKIFQLYYQAALDLEMDGIQYLPKINRTKQLYLEAVEIHYKVHSFALRRIKELSTNQRATMSFALHKEVATIYAYLRLFRHHGVQQRSQDGRKSAERFYEDWRVDMEIIEFDKQQKQIQKEQNDNDYVILLNDEGSSKNEVIKSVVDASVSIVDHSLQIEEMCVAAFEHILQRFPHYKAAFRLAEMAIKQNVKNYKKAVTILFEKLFLAGRKQRSNNFLENVVEIKRTDFERNGSFPYHLYKIVKLAIMASAQCRDVLRMKNLIVSLTAYKVTTNSSRETLSDRQIRELMANSLLAFYRIAMEMSQKDGQDIEKLSKLIEYLEEVLQRLKKDKRFLCTDLDLLLIACVRRRDKLAPQPEPDDDIIAIERKEEEAALPSTSSSTSGSNQQLPHFSNLPGSSISIITKEKLSVPWKKRQLIVAGEQQSTTNDANPPKLQKFQQAAASSNSTTILIQSRMTGLPPTAKSSSTSNQLPPHFSNLIGSNSTAPQHPVPWKKSKIDEQMTTNDANPTKFASNSTTIPTQQSRMTGLPPTTKIKQLKQNHLPTQQSQQNVAMGGIASKQQQQMMKTEQQQSSTKQPLAIAIVHPRQQQNVQVTRCEPQQQILSTQQHPNQHMNIENAGGVGVSGQQQRQSLSQDLIMEVARLYQQQLQQMLTTAQQQQQQIGESSNTQNERSTGGLTSFNADALRRYLLNVQHFRQQAQNSSQQSSNIGSGNQQRIDGGVSSTQQQNRGGQGQQIHQQPQVLPNERTISNLLATLQSAQTRQQQANIGSGNQQQIGGGGSSTQQKNRGGQGQQIHRQPLVLPNEGTTINNVLTTLPSAQTRQQQTNSSFLTMHQPINSNQTSSIASILSQPQSSTNSRYLGRGYNQLAQLLGRQQQAQQSSAAALSSPTQFPALSAVRQSASSLAQQRALVEQLLRVQQVENIQQLRERLGMGGGGTSNPKGTGEGKQQQNQQHFG